MDNVGKKDNKAMGQNKNMFWGRMRLFCMMIVVACIPWLTVLGHADEIASSVEVTHSGVTLPHAVLPKVMQYWQYRAVGDIAPLYELEAPHIKYQVDLKKYLLLHKKARKLNGVKLLNVHGGEDRLKIRVKIFYEANGKSRSSVIYDRWIKLEDVWYHAYENKIFGVF